MGLRWAMMAYLDCPQSLNYKYVSSGIQFNINQRRFHGKNLKLTCRMQCISFITYPCRLSYSYLAVNLVSVCTRLRNGFNCCLTCTYWLTKLKYPFQCDKSQRKPNVFVRRIQENCSREVQLHIHVSMSIDIRKLVVSKYILTILFCRPTVLFV